MFNLFLFLLSKSVSGFLGMIPETKIFLMLRTFSKNKWTNGYFVLLRGIIVITIDCLFFSDFEKNQTRGFSRTMCRPLTLTFKVFILIVPLNLDF